MTKLQLQLAKTYEEKGYNDTLAFWTERQEEIALLDEKERVSLKSMMSRYCRINGDEKNAAIVLAEKKNPQSKEGITFFFDFAKIYHCGKNVEKDETKSKTLCRMIVEQGDSDDLYKLGLMYKSGDGVSQDYAKAAECFQKVAVAGNKIAQFLLAEMYMRGLGVEKSRAEAEKWYTGANAEKDRYSTGLSRMTIPDGIEVIEECAFEGFDELRTVVIPPSVKNIGSKAFANCRNLRSVNFQNPKIRVSYDSFSACENLDDETKTLVKKFSSSTEMIFVEGGTFERAGFSIAVSSFEIGKFQVTQKLYEEVMGKNSSEFKGENNPVECVSWYDAVKFCNALSEKAGLEPCYVEGGECDFTKNGYRLPTEVEWIFAARGGNKSNGYEYAGSNKIDEVAWYSENSDSSTHEVGQKKPNELGIYDMSGNVWEWCNAWHGTYEYCEQTDPHGALSGYNRVMRGGSWDNYANHCAVSCLVNCNPGSRSSCIGFRIVRSTTEK